MYNTLHETKHHPNINVLLCLKNPVFMQNKDWNIMKLAGMTSKLSYLMLKNSKPNRSLSILIVLECKWRKLQPVRNLSKCFLTSHTNFIGTKHRSQHNDYLFSERPSRINHRQHKKCKWHCSLNCKSFELLFMGNMMCFLRHQAAAKHIFLLSPFKGQCQGWVCVGEGGQTKYMGHLLTLWPSVIKSGVKLLQITHVLMSISVTIANQI